MSRTVYRACQLCEAICGLEIRLDDEERIVSIRGDEQDPFSHGHICPKAVALQDLQNDPDRLRAPVRRSGRDWQEISWDEAFDECVEKIAAIRERYGNDSIGAYAGNPSVHNYGILTHGNAFLGLLKSRNRFSASSVDQMPHQLVAYWMFGHQFMLPIPDIDHTDHFILIGGNPMVSNGSLMTVPDFRGRLKALQARGGRLIVIDPRRTETARKADEHHFIRPGSDAALLLAMLHTLYEEDLVAPGRLASFTTSLQELPARLQRFSPERAAAVTGIAAGEIRRLARELAAARRGVCFGRMGVSVQPYASVCHWAINLINLLTGNLDRPGGALFTQPAWDLAGPGSRTGHFDVWRSRVSGLPEFNGELPASVMAEEMLTPGEGRIRAMVTTAGNPVLSTPNGRRLDRALAGLDFMMSIDPYINETTRHAHIILPPTGPLEKEHYDITFNQLAVRNVVRYNEAVYDKPAGCFHEWEMFNELAQRMAQRLGKAHKLLPAPAEILETMLRTGVYGRDSGHALALDLETLKKHPHGIDLGPLQSTLPGKLHTRDKRIDATPSAIIADLDRVDRQLFAARGDDDDGALCLISRRHLRSNNSWMHNSLRLVKGKDRCDLIMHPDDASARRLTTGERVSIRSRTGVVVAMLTVSDEMMRGVVCLPHGWGHDRDGVRMQIAAEHAGASINDLTDETLLDPVSGNAALSGVSVSVAPDYS